MPTPETIVTHTAKTPERCPHCGGRKLIRKGIRRKKLESVQRWQCKVCHRVFTPGPGAMRGKTYPLRAILDGLIWYHQGFTLAETGAKLKSRHGIMVGPSTVAVWITEHKRLCSYARLRAAGRRLFSPSQIVRSVKLYHRQVYAFGAHRAKLALLLGNGTEHQRLNGLAEFLERAPRECPHELFRDGARASQTKGIFDVGQLVIGEKENFATNAAALVLPTIGDNRLRHEALQQFMLATDSVTVAVEVPIWLLPEEIDFLRKRFDLPAALGAGGPITGHIDFLQIRNGAVHILDYKPDARTNRPVEQLTIYALALAFRTGLRLYDFKCAWFNAEQYCEFFPLHAVALRRGK